jgi:hypothetical protein
MSASELAAAVRELLDVDREAFQAEVRAEAEQLKREVRDGTFDNNQAIIGLELELYAVDDRTDALMRVPRPLLERIGFEKELGLHNAEVQTSPQPLNTHGLIAQKRELQANLAPAIERASAEGIRLVSDGMWTVPPNGETAHEYLSDYVEEDGIRLGTNMSDAARYHTMANTDYPSAMCLEAPNVSMECATVMPESLITSIQPHVQIPHAPDLPEYFAYALRVAGPLLALGVNSPFFPPDLYDDDVPDGAILRDAWMEHRISVFESVLNTADGSRPDKVCFPRDFDSVEAAIDRIAEEDLIVPTDITTGQRFDDRFAHFRHKHGSYWRWVRPVFDGATRSQANARIEFRPLPAQPTIHDAIAFQAVFAGLLESLPRREHPVRDLDWETAEANFYAACRDGLDAEMTWITGEGETESIDEIYSELFECARDGLELKGLSTAEAHEYIRPLRERVDRRITPARWKFGYVRRRVQEGVPLAEAIWGMQSQYITEQRDSLIEGEFTDWLT